MRGAKTSEKSCGRKYLSIAELSKKWKTLRDYYMKVNGDIETRISNGSPATQKIDQKSKTWKHYYAMKFLDDSFEKRKTVSNVVNNQETELVEYLKPKLKLRKHLAAQLKKSG